MTVSLRKDSQEQRTAELITIADRLKREDNLRTNHALNGLLGGFTVDHRKGGK